MENTESEKVDSKQHPAVGYVSKPFEYNYNFKDVIIYNLGIGASLKDTSGLQYLYEGHEKFGPIPSFAVLAPFAGTFWSNLVQILVQFGYICNLF